MIMEPKVYVQFLYSLYRKFGDCDSIYKKTSITETINILDIIINIKNKNFKFVPTKFFLVDF